MYWAGPKAKASCCIVWRRSPGSSNHLAALRGRFRDVGYVHIIRAFGATAATSAVVNADGACMGCATRNITQLKAAREEKAERIDNLMAYMSVDV
jgi:hypothetical protein